MKKKTKKLVLAKETLQSLDRHGLKEVAGGVSILEATCITCACPEN